jgi:hypothetical protein
MSLYDEYRIVINEAQRRLIMRALTNAMASDRHSTEGLSHATRDEWMQLIRLFSMIKPSVRKAPPWPITMAEMSKSLAEMNKSRDVVWATNERSALDVLGECFSPHFSHTAEPGGAEFNLLCQLAPARSGGWGLPSCWLKRSTVMSTISFVAIAIIIVLASIVYEFTVVDRFIAEQELQDESDRRPWWSSPQPFRFLLRQPASNHRLRYLLGGLAIKLVAFGKLALIQVSKRRPHPGMNERSPRLYDDWNLIVVLVTEPVERHELQ